MTIKQEEYTCPMHPQINQSYPGSCPICGMSLEAKSFKINEEDEEYHQMLIRFIVATVLTIPILFLAMAPMFSFFKGVIPLELLRFLQFVLATPVVLWAGFFFFQRGWQSVVNRSLNMFSLISLGVGVSYLYSLVAYFSPSVFPSDFLHEGQIPLYFETAAAITTLVILGQLLELRARKQTNFAIQALLNKAAKSARVIREGKEIEVSINDVNVQDILRVKPGDKIPVDGVVIEGRSFVDESMVTGEPIPTEKEPKSLVIGGTINQQGSFLMEAKKVGSETLLSQIIEMVLEASRSRASIQSLADKISSYFVPIVLLISLLTLILWTLFGPKPSLVYGIVNAVSVLMIACPCALGLATPISIVVGMGKGAESGILIKNAEALEKLENVKTILVDKTGTLTEGKPKVNRIIAEDASLKNEVLQYAAALERYSEHPLSHAILDAFKEISDKFRDVEDFKSLRGRGVSGKVLNHDVLVGNLKFLEENGIKNLPVFNQKIKDVLDETSSKIFVSVDKKVIGLIEVSDKIKESTFKAIEILDQLGINMIIVSGDQEKAVESVAKKLSIKQFYSNILPDQKLRIVKEVKGQKGLVAMVGDGVNDAPALAASDLGIAMGTGTDVAMESADVTLVKGDLMGISKAITLSRSVMKNIRENLFFAFFYNILGIPIAAGLLYPFTGMLLNPIIAAFAMSLSSVSVIMNSLRLKNLKLSSE